jgi:hypothetical protein
MKTIEPKVNQEDKDLMERLLSTGHITLKYAVRIQTVLLRHRGKSTQDIAEF